MYTFGTLLVGIAASGVDPERLPLGILTVLALYFLFPANLLIYGVNDLFDTETDLLNEKKTNYESRLDQTSRSRTLLWIVALNLPFIVLIVALSPATLVPLAIFLLLGIFYSAPPIRAKSIPVLDSAFNVLYVMPAVIAFVALTGRYPHIVAVIAAASWTAAMHAYSAIPDIAADRAAGVRTIATLLGPRWTLAACGLLFLTASALSFAYLGSLSVVLGIVYVSLILASFRHETDGRLFDIYRRFPLINSLSGFAIFLYIVLTTV